MNENQIPDDDRRLLVRSEDGPEFPRQVRHEEVYPQARYRAFQLLRVTPAGIGRLRIVGSCRKPSWMRHLVASPEAKAARGFPSNGRP